MTARLIVSGTPAVPVAIVAHRDAIRAIDAQIVALLAARVQYARAIGREKQGAGLPVLDPAREADVVRAMGTAARAAGLPVEPVREIAWRIIALARHVQETADATAEAP